MKDGNKRIMISIVSFLLILTLIAPIHAVGDLSTEDTFESTGGHYSVDYILNAFNVFSFDTASGSHIVGPIAAKGDLKNLNGGNLTYSNVHHGVSSYIKGTLRNGIMGALNQSGLIPTQYFGTVNTISNDGSNFNVNGNYFVPTEKVVGVKQTDDYIDWKKAHQLLSEESKDLLQTSTRVIAKEDVKIIDGQ